MITSSPGPMSAAMRLMSNASVPEETPIACRQPMYAAISSSKDFTFGPRMKC